MEPSSSLTWPRPSPIVPYELIRTIARFSTPQVGARLRRLSHTTSNVVLTADLVHVKSLDLWTQYDNQAIKHIDEEGYFATNITCAHCYRIKGDIFTTLVSWDEEQQKALSWLLVMKGIRVHDPSEASWWLNHLVEVNEEDIGVVAPPAGEVGLTYGGLAMVKDVEDVVQTVRVLLQIGAYPLDEINGESAMVWAIHRQCWDLVMLMFEYVGQLEGLEYLHYRDWMHDDRLQHFILFGHVNYSFRRVSALSTNYLESVQQLFGLRGVQKQESHHLLNW
ncbi:hypothetical protein HK104_003484 [Borealophlyctis nickersoniae]|nr:hypothetical protein HK104_003484 [Borealophlyctis nickersoniae]